MKSVTMLVLAVGILSGGVVHAEDITGKVGRFRLTASDGTLLEGKRGYFTTTNFIFRHFDNSRDTIALEDIGSMEEYKGNSADTYSAIGTLSGVLAGFLIAYGSGKLDVDHADGGAVDGIAALAVTGAFSGWLWGMALERWERVPLSVTFTGDIENRTGYVILSLNL